MTRIMGSKRSFAILLLVCALAACQQKAPSETKTTAAGEPVESRSSGVPPGASVESPAETADSGVANGNVAIPPVAVSAKLPPPGGLRFVGLWAADVKSCSSATWRFSETSLRAPAGSHCTFSKVTPVPGGYDIAATCTADGPAKPETIKLRFAESAQAMLVDSDTIAGVGLIYCGREG